MNTERPFPRPAPASEAHSPVHTPGGAPPLRLRIPKLIDVVLVSEPDQIQWLNQHEAVTRPLDPSASWLHRFIEGRLSGDLGFHGKRLPVFLARGDQARAERQRKLDDALENARGMPGVERDTIAGFVSGETIPDEIGVMVQQWCGRLFLAHYRSARETYEAGRLLATWASAPPWRTFLDRKSGKLDRAKATLAAAAEGDLHCVHATSIGMENIAKTVRRLRAAAKDPRRQQLTPDDVVRQCLAAPPAVLRGCARELSVPFLSEPLTTRSVIVFLVAEAYARSGDLDVAFLGEGWSACPAREVVPEMLRAAWHTAHHEAPANGNLFATINTWTRRWQRGVS